MEEKQWRDRRRYGRAKIRRQARYKIVDGRDPKHVSRPLRGWVITLGGGGVMLVVRELDSDGLHISFDEDMIVQNWIALEFDLIPGRSPIKALGKVAWYQFATNHTEDYRYDVGIEFKEILDSDRKEITAFVDRHNLM